MERVIRISSALVLQERKLNARKKFKRMRLLRKEGEKEKGGKVQVQLGCASLNLDLDSVALKGEKDKGGKKENDGRDFGKNKEKRKKRRGSSLRPDLAEYKVLAKRRGEKSKLFIGGERCGHAGKCEGPLRSTPSDPAEEFPPHCCRQNNARTQS